jgi:excisionase family DNA binding protein
LSGASASDNSFSSQPARVYLSTADVARALGVSVSTVKRWVDSGVLPAHKTAGGHRKLLMADVVELVRRQNLPTVDLPSLAVPARGADEDLSAGRDHLYEAVRAGDHGSVRRVLLGLVDQKQAIADIADEVIAPVMGRIGSDWQSGRIDVMHEHRGTHLIILTLGEVKSRIISRNAGRAPVGRAMGGCPPGDHYLIPTIMAELVLAEAGWETIQLGPNTPFESFVNGLGEFKPALAWLTVSYVEEKEPFLDGYRHFFAEASAVGVPVIVGGRALGADLRTRMSYSSFGDHLRTLRAFADSIRSRPIAG